VSKSLHSVLTSLASAGQLTVLSIICAAGTASGQTAPQLLPYTAKLIAGGGPSTTPSGGTCPVSGFTATDAYGDGCLATEIEIGNTASGLSTPGARSAVADANGNVFFTDYVAGLVRRVDASTGIVTAVAGGASSSPAAGATCGTLTSTDSRGDGCLATSVKLSHPAGLILSPAGDLYFSDIGYVNVRKIAATAGVITTTGVISLVAGNISGTFGYASGVNAATASYLQDPYGLAFDNAGNLYIADEYTKAEAILVVNTNTTGSTTVTGVTIPAGQIVKIVGSPTGGGTVCPNSPATTNGCNYGTWTDGTIANASQVDGPYAVTFDPAGNVYFANEFNDDIGKVTSAGIISNFAGIQASVAKVLKRGPAGSFAVGSSFGVAADANSNVYFTDASSGVVWRVDGAGQSMYVVAGGATTLCTAAIDAWGDGCPATQAKFGSSGTTYASTTLPAPGIFGIAVDAYSDLFTGDTETNLVREIASGTRFGNIGENQSVTQTVDIHFATSDVAASASPYTITSGPFTVGTPTCTLNSDATTDCLLPLTATPTALGAFTGTLVVKSSLGGVGTFPLSGIAVMTPVTRISIAASSSSSCSGTTVYSTTTALTFTATIVSSGSPTGTVTFYGNGTQIGSAQPVSNGVATLSYTFTTAGTYNVTATYSGDTYYHTSTTASAATITSSSPSFTASPIIYQENAVVPGQAGLYSFTLSQNVYAGTITMACSGLPANSSCMFSPQTITASGCSATNTIALSILTQTGPVSSSGAALGSSGNGLWSLFSTGFGFGLALLIGYRRRRSSMRLGSVWMVLALLIGASGMLACGSGLTGGGAATPAGNYTITVTATGSTGSTSTFTVPLKVL